MLSVNTNYSAMIALQNLNSTNTDLETVQNKISTGLKVANAKDNGAVFAIAQGQRARVSGRRCAAQATTGASIINAMKLDSSQQNGSQASSERSSRAASISTEVALTVPMMNDPAAMAA